MEKIFKIKASALAATVVLSGLALSGCGSSSSGVTTTSVSSNGIYSGNITGGSTSFNGVEEKGIIFNGRLLVLSNNANGVSQIFDGTLTEPAISLAGTGASYSPTVKRGDIAYDGSFSTGLSATINFTEITTGTPTVPVGTIALTSDTAAYDKGADTTRLAGTWTGIFASGFALSMSLAIDATGNILGGSSSADLFTDGCLFTGSLSVIDAAVNVYRVNLISDGGSGQCTLPTGAYSGLSWTEGATNGTLVLMAADGSKGRAVVLTKN